MDARTARGSLVGVGWLALVIVGVPALVLCFVKGAPVIGRALDVFAQGDPARAFVTMGVVVTLPVWWGVAGAVVLHLRGRDRFPDWFGWSVLSLVLPALLLIPGGRSTGVSDSWVQAVDAKTGGLGDEAAAGWLMGALGALGGAVLAMGLSVWLERHHPRFVAGTRGRDVALGCLALTIVGALALGVCFETW